MALAQSVCRIQIPGESAQRSNISVNRRVDPVIAPHLPGLRDALRMTDVATPLTYWSMARSWRGKCRRRSPPAHAAFASFVISPLGMTLTVIW